MKGNPFINFKKSPNYSKITPGCADDAMAFVLSNFDKSIENAVHSKISWVDLWTPLFESMENLDRVWGHVNHVHNVIDSPEWRKIHKKYVSMVSASYNKLFQDERIFNNLIKLNDEKLTRTQQYLIERILMDFKASGVELPDGAKSKFLENNKKLSELSAKFNENIMDSTDDKSQNIIINDESLLGAMPKDIKVSFLNNDNCWEFTLKQPSFMALMKYCTDRSLREKMYYRYSIRSSELGDAKNDNSSIIKEILTIRAENAEVLGYNNFSELKLSDKMAKSPDVVINFLNNLLSSAYPMANDEMNKLKEFATTRFNIEKLMPWDLGFVSDHYCQDLFNFKSSEMRNYLIFENIIQGMLNCASKIFDISFEIAESEKWVDEVLYYNIKNKDGEIIAGIYFDLFARDSKKGGGWMQGALSRCYRNSEIQFPIANIICNFTPPAKNTKALLNWEDVRVLFHEFGHALHHTLTEVDEYCASGINNVEWDAVELPSQFMENFMWDWRIIEPIAVHFETGEKMPYRLFEKALNSRKFLSGLFLVRQIKFALFDMMLHTGNSTDYMGDI